MRPNFSSSDSDNSLFLCFGGGEGDFLFSTTLCFDTTGALGGDTEFLLFLGRYDCCGEGERLLGGLGRGDGLYLLRGGLADGEERLGLRGGLGEILFACFFGGGGEREDDDEELLPDMDAEECRLLLTGLLLLLCLGGGGKRRGGLLLRGDGLRLGL